jgi:predicted MFS family arabinose efflux permease
VGACWNGRDVLGAYRPLFATGDARRVVAASLSARLAIGAFGLPLLLTVQRTTGSFAAAGLASGAFALGVAIFAPVRGRLVDRLAAAQALPAMGVLSAVCLVAVAAMADGGAALWPLVTLAFGAGATTPPLVASMRLEWQRVLGAGDARLAQAYAFEAGAQTAMFIVGPLLAGAGIATIGPRLTLVCTSTTLVAGTLAFASVARAPSEAGSARSSSPIRRPGVLTLVLATALADVGLGGVDVGVPAFVTDRGRAQLAGVLLAVFAASAVAGALLFGTRQWRAAPGAQLILLGLLSCALTAALALPTALLPLSLVLAVAGAPSAAQWAASSLALDAASGGRAGAEAFTWMSTANSVGIALGTAGAGAAVQAWGTDTAFLLAAAGPLGAATLVAGRRATL